MGDPALNELWSAFVAAKVNGERIPLGPTHWARGLHAPVAFPYQRPTEASTLASSARSWLTTSCSSWPKSSRKERSAARTRRSSSPVRSIVCMPED